MTEHIDDAGGLPAVFASTEHVDQVVAIEADHDHITISVTGPAAVELARIIGHYRKATRSGFQLDARSDTFSDELWHDVGQALNVGVLQATTEGRSRYVAPRDPDATGRQRRDGAPLTIVGSDQ